MSTEQTTAVATTPTERPKVPVGIGYRGLEVKTLEDLWRVSGYIAKSGLAPKGIETPEAIFTALELGLELGLPPMAALQNIAVINGRPGVFGDVQLALVRASGLLEEYSEVEVGNPKDDTWGVQCVCKRVGSKFANSIFTVADAKRAQLWGKSGPWSQYPKRMLKFRARGYLLRDEFGDVLKGVKSVEELRDTEEEDRFQRAKRVNGLPPSPPPPPSLSPEAPEPTVMVDRASVTTNEKAEADAGLAPAQSETATATEPKANAGAKLGEWMTSSAITWEMFRTYGVSQGWKAPWADADGFEALGVLAADAAEGFWVVRERIAKAIGRAKAEGKL
jgi:hypothetical protein